jgi:putative hydrolase of the HAD superfamily
MAISTIVFDFGNVVAWFSHRKSAEQLAVYGTASAASIAAYLFGGKLEDDFEAGRIDGKVLIGMVRETFHLYCTDEQFTQAFVDMFRANDEVCELLPRLKPRHRLVLLSNTNELHARHFLEKFRDQLAPFDAIVLSYKVGLRKPDPRVYEYCRQQGGSPPACECLFIDDLPANVEGARACGWQGLVYRQGEDLAKRLAELGVQVGPPASRLARSVS